MAAMSKFFDAVKSLMLVMAAVGAPVRSRVSKIAESGRLRPSGAAS